MLLTDKENLSSLPTKISVLIRQMAVLTIASLILASLLPYYYFFDPPVTKKYLMSLVSFLFAYSKSAQIASQLLSINNLQLQFRAFSFPPISLITTFFYLRKELNIKLENLKKLSN